MEDDIFKKLVTNGRKDALDSVESFRNAAKEFGYTEEEIEDALVIFPLSDDDIEGVSGGYQPRRPRVYRHRPTK